MQNIKYYLISFGTSKSNNKCLKYMYVIYVFNLLICNNSSYVPNCKRKIAK